MLRPLPDDFKWLLKEPGPRMLKEVLPLHGIREKAGPGNNPVIMDWAREVGLDKVYTADSIPWCGLGMALVAKRASWGDAIPKDPLWARNWANFGQKAKVPSLADVLVFSRSGGGGHVGEYVGENKKFYFVFGFNQGDAVSIVAIEKKRLIAARHPIWRVAEPPNRRPVFFESSVHLSVNEA